MQDNTKKRFLSLDGFRGIAAICVVVFHTHIFNSIGEQTFFKNSAIFVDFFFALSGFVITHSYISKKDLNIYKFLKSRFYRLYPLHFFMFIIFFTLEILKLVAVEHGSFNFKNAPFTDKTALSEVVPNLLLIQSWSPFSNHLSFNYPSWSISVEFYMYIMLFITLIIIKKFRLLIWLTIVLVSLTALLGKEQHTTFRYEVFQGIFNFFCGASSYYIYKKIKNINIQTKVASAIEVSLLVLIYFGITENIDYKSFILTSLFIATIIIFSLENGIISTILKHRHFQYIGELSYSIYMTHATIIFLITALILVVQKAIDKDITLKTNKYIYIDLGTPWLNNILLILLIATVLLVSKYTFKNIECRFRA